MAACSGRVAGRQKHPRELLRHPDRGHTRPPLLRSRIQVSTHQVDLAVGRLANRTIGISLSSAKEATARRNAVPIFSKIAGEGTGTQVPGTRHLTADLHPARSR